MNSEQRERLANSPSLRISHVQVFAFQLAICRSDTEQVLPFGEL